jgi:glycogen debranching enzyme
VIPPDNEPDWTGATPGVPFNIQVHIADNPPLFAWAEYENAMMHGDLEYVKELLYKKQALQRQYEWLENLKEKVLLPNVRNLTHWLSEEDGYKWEGGCSGMDNTPRGRVCDLSQKQRPNNPDMLWLDAICQQALSALVISEMFKIVEDSTNAELWENEYNKKKNIVNKYYWDDKDGFYYDIDCNTKEYYKVMTIASYWALTSKIASKDQAKALLKQAENPKTLGGDLPLISLSKSDENYSKDGVYWRGSMWLPTTYAALRGFTEYGFHKESHEMALKILNHMYKTYTDFEPHTIWECYAPEEPKPSYNETFRPEYVRPDFCGWSALGPISVFIEYVLGFHTIDAFKNTVEWAKPDDLEGKFGIKRLKFGNVTTDIIADGDEVTVSSSAAYTLIINGRSFEISKGENKIQL